MLPVRSSIVPITLLALAIGVLHVLGVSHNLYWVLPWYDLLLHFLGGMWVAWLAFWFFVLFRLWPALPATPAPATVLLLLLSTTFVVGGAYEVFEYLVRVFDARNYVLDTTTDVIMDMAGALAAFQLVLLSRFRSAIS